jgi:CheY-like chemotaxis protein
VRLNSIPTRVLIVDDNPLHVDILVTAFGRLGTADIVTALDGYEAKALLDEAEQAFDLMVLDLCLPGFDGFEVLNHLISCQSQTRFILLSGMPKHILDMAEEFSQTKKLNIMATLQKPISISALMDVVGRQDWAQPATIPPSRINHSS